MTVEIGAGPELGIVAPWSWHSSKREPWFHHLEPRALRGPRRAAWPGLCAWGPAGVRHKQQGAA